MRQLERQQNVLSIIQEVMMMTVHSFLELIYWTSLFRITQGNAIVVYWVPQPLIVLSHRRDEGGRSDDVSYILAKTITRAIFLIFLPPL